MLHFEDKKNAMNGDAVVERDTIVRKDVKWGQKDTSEEKTDTERETELKHHSS